MAGYLLLDNSTNSLRRLKELPVLTPGDLLNQTKARPAPEPVRVRGRLSQRPTDRAYRLQDASHTNSVGIESSQMANVSVEMEVEAIGFASRKGGEWVLTNTFLQAIGKQRTVEPQPLATTNNALPELSQVLQIRRLSTEQAAQGYPVKVTGVLTFFAPRGYRHFIQDDTAGIYLELDHLAKDTPLLAAGQRVEVNGFSGSGSFAPVIHAEHVRVLDREGIFPRAIPTSGQLLMTGVEDSQWVSLQGVIRRQLPDTNGAATLVLSTGDTLVNLVVGGENTLSAPADLVDAVVEVHGVCRTRFNDKRQLTSIELDIPDWTHLQTLEAALRDPFALPVHPIEELFQFHSSRSALRRTQIQGQVLLRQSDRSFFMQDGSGGIRVQRSESWNVTNGMSVAVVGFPGFVDGLPILQDAVVKVLGAALPPAPKQLTSESALNQAFHGTLVELEGTVIGHAVRGHSQLLTIAFGQQPVEAVLEPAGSTLADIISGSKVRIRGVYAAQLDENHELASFQVLLPSRSEVAVLSHPSWWTSRRTGWVLGALGAGLLMTIVWIRLLRHQVKRRTHELRAEIAERKRGEETLRESEARFSTIFHSSPVAISLSVLTNGHFLDVNERFLRLFGFTREELKERTTSEANIWLRKEDRERLISRLQAGERGEQLETKFRWKSGEIGDALVSGSLVQVRDESCLLCMIADITEHKKLEDQLRQSQKMEGIGQLAGGMAHEFNNILAAVLMSLELAETSPAAESGSLLQEVKGLCLKAAQMIKQLLAFSRKSVIQLHPLELGAAYLRQQKILQALMGERIALEFCVPFSRQSVNADSVLMEQVLLNLCLNARDAMPDGGSLKIRVDDVEFASEKLLADARARLGRYVCLAVTDTGCGMEARTLERLFEPFFTTKGVGHGTGLGLATVRGIVEQHRGWVEVESAVGRGTTFKVFLPALAGVQAAGLETHAPPISVHGSGTILVVEDEPAIRVLTRKLLSKHGYEVMESSNGEEALALWAKRQQEIDLLLTDMVMPGAISGLDLAKQALADKPGLRVIIVSGYNTDVLDPQQPLQDSIIYLPKPVPPGTLTQVIRECLRGGTPSDPPSPPA
jgi:PAS domain S-box-containing protein